MRSTTRFWIACGAFVLVQIFMVYRGLSEGANGPSQPAHVGAQ